MGFIHYNITLEEQVAAVQAAKAVSPTVNGSTRASPSVGPSGCVATLRLLVCIALVLSQLGVP